MEAELTVKLKVMPAVLPLVSLAVTPKLLLPAAVGVPEIKPVEDMVRPVGKLPELKT